MWRIWVAVNHVASFYHLRKDIHRGQLTFLRVADLLFSCAVKVDKPPYFSEPVSSSRWLEKRCVWCSWKSPLAWKKISVIFAWGESVRESVHVTLGPLVILLKNHRSLNSPFWAHTSDVCVDTLTHTTLPGLSYSLTQKLICNGMYSFPGDQKALLVHATEFLPEIYKHDS